MVCTGHLYDGDHASNGVAGVTTLPLLMFNASMDCCCQTASITALLLLIPSIGFTSVVVERFPKADVLAIWAVYPATDTNLNRPLSRRGIDSRAEAPALMIPFVICQWLQTVTIARTHVTP